uniref:Alpha-L-arabinofuranosidase C-terminal domain-containing protein n=2 Tax=Lotus japonicus TaxID=34305 RepID=I3S1C9_LOTJA|nr:unknown [Lotus japonicus]
MFTESSGATLLKSTLQTSSQSLVASAIEYANSEDKKNYIRVKVVNFGSGSESFRISINGLKSKVKQSGSRKTVLTAANVMDENSFSEPNKIVPQQTPIEGASTDMKVELPPHSVTSFDLLK